uniref:Uncharacterized protein n=1 Tax=Oryzias sinensis TaxID=183150 RepID=A0A8C7X4Y8_9TELE
MAATEAAALTASPERLTVNQQVSARCLRQRVNSSNEKPTSPLGPEVLKQQPDPQMEKADLLEMNDHGYFRWIQEVQDFLSTEELKTRPHLLIIASVLYVMCMHRISKDRGLLSGALWRLWRHLQAEVPE